MYVFIDLASSAISLSDDRIIIIIARALYYLWVIAKLDVYRSWVTWSFSSLKI